MGTTQPIKKLEDVEALRKYYLEEEPNARNYALICTGLNTALRISDILSLRWGDVYDFRNFEFRQYITVIEQKTGKISRILMNDNILHALRVYMNNVTVITPELYLFFGKNRSQPISRSQAYRVIHHACSMLGFEGSYSCHSLRKTFGYHAWMGGASPALLMLILIILLFRLPSAI